MILSHAENAENSEIFREDVRDVTDTAGSVGMHTDIFRHDQQDGHDFVSRRERRELVVFRVVRDVTDTAGHVGMHTDIFRRDQQDGLDVDGA